METDIKLSEITKAFHPNEVFVKFSATFPRAATTCILGPSGCGKTTLLRMIAGIIKPNDGSFSGIENQMISYVFQEDRLLPWKTAAENIRLVLKHRVNAEEIDSIVQKNLALVQMTDYASYYPHQMSGGMRQRISFARAFSYPSDIILLDEPFKGLDLPLKQQLMNQVRAVLSHDPRTVVYVTHEPEEAVFFGNKIIILSHRPAQILDEITQDHRNQTSGNSKKILSQIKSKLQQ